MRLSRRFGARAGLATLLIPVLAVSAFGQAAPTAAQQPPAQTPTTPPAPTQPATAATPPTPVQEQRANGPTVTLSVDDTVKRGLEFNLDVQVERINPRLQDLTIQNVASAWIPSVSNDTRFRSQTDVPIDVLLGDRFSQRTFATSSQLQQELPWYGTSYSVGWTNDRVTSIGARNLAFNPSLSTNATFNLTQPLLRDFVTDANRTQYRVSRKQREITDVALQQTIIQTTRQVQIAYWELFYARANLQVAQQSLDLARQTLRDNRTRVEVGTMAPIDIVRAEAEVARNEETAILAAAQIDTAEDTLRRLILDPQSPDYWTTNLDLTDAPPPIANTDVNVEAAVAVALQQRTDLIQQRKSIEATDINIRYYKNQLLPAVDFFANYGFFARGGFNPGDPTADPIVPPISNSWTDILDSAFGRDNPRWTVGVQFSYPLGRSSQDVTLVRSRLQYQQQQLGLKDAELQAANEVRTAGRNVNTNRRRVDAARSSRVLSERQLEAEQKKFAVGLATSFEVVQAQRDLAQARNSELQAIVAYVESLVNFEASQKAGTSGASASGPGGGGTGGTNNTTTTTTTGIQGGSRQQ